MNEIILEVSERQITTKSSLHKVRESGLIPGIVYGEKEKNIAISVKEKDFYHIIHTESFETLKEARQKERFYKSTTGRRRIKEMFFSPQLV